MGDVKTTTISVRLSKRLRSQIEALAVLNGTSTSHEALCALELHVQAMRKDPALLMAAKQRVQEESAARLAEMLSAVDLLLQDAE